VGYAVFDDNCCLQEHDFIDLTKMDDFFKKIEFMKTFLVDIGNRYKIEKIFIEEPLQNSFVTTHRTVAVLNFFVGSVVGVCSSLITDKVYFINFTRARSSCGIRVLKRLKESSGSENSSISTKKSVRDFLILKGYILKEKVTKNGTVDKRTYDMSDAVFVGYSGFHGIGVIELFRTGKKRRKGNAKRS
ncbi:MAG: hypothetical protein N3A54_01040, partial [Patescibacteria group bacterium]|nr:hypothetical protein [Patescibacteria group bacterium]